MDNYAQLPSLSLYSKFRVFYKQWPPRGEHKAAFFMNTLTHSAKSNSLLGSSMRLSFLSPPFVLLYTPPLVPA